MKKSFILSFLHIGLLTYAQVGIGTTTPRGALDINKPTTNDNGLVLPTNSDVSNIINPQNGGSPVPGTIMYDSTLDCVRLYRENNSWSNCVGEKNSSEAAIKGKGVFMATSHLTTFDSQPWLEHIVNRKNFGANEGIYDKSISWVKAGQPVRTHSISNPGQSSTNRGGTAVEDMISGEEIYSRYNIVHAENSLIASISIDSNNTRAILLADKLKDYVNRGGVLFINLSQRNDTGGRVLAQSLFKEYTGKNLNYTSSRSFLHKDVVITNHDVNNGPFGDQRNIKYFTNNNDSRSRETLPYGLISSTDLPEGSEVYLENLDTKEALVFATGPGNRVVFYFGHTINILPRNLTTASDIQKLKSVFSFNQMVNLINKTN